MLCNSALNSQNTLIHTRAEKQITSDFIKGMQCRHPPFDCRNERIPLSVKRNLSLNVLKLSAHNDEARHQALICVFLSYFETSLYLVPVINKISPIIFVLTTR